MGHQCSCFLYLRIWQLSLSFFYLYYITFYSCETSYILPYLNCLYGLEETYIVLIYNPRHLYMVFYTVPDTIYYYIFVHAAVHYAWMIAYHHPNSYFHPYLQYPPKIHSV